LQNHYTNKRSINQANTVYFFVFFQERLVIKKNSPTTNRTLLLDYLHIFEKELSNKITVYSD